MNHFFTQLPVIITQFSLALIKVLTDQLKWLGSIYYHIETALLGTVADISLAILSLRYVFLLLVIGGALGYFGLWWFLAGYVLIILIAVVQFFRSARLPPDPDVEKAHQELRDKSVKFLRIPLRVLAMLVSLYFSWQFMDWKAMTPSSFESLAEAKQVVASSKEETINGVVSTVSLPEKSAEVTTEQPTVSNTFDESQWESVKTKTCEIAWNNKDFKNGYCSLGEFPAGEYRIKPQSSLRAVCADATEIIFPPEGQDISIWSNSRDNIKLKNAEIFEGYTLIKNHRIGMIVMRVNDNYPISTWQTSLSNNDTLSVSINFPPTEANWKAQRFYGSITIQVFKKNPE
ncbi:hypothetical protein BCS42_14755 [Crenothrix sp. D3]|nr:hypothetical protein BCS42_14755 [Crenothrix sp. D3]